MPASQRHRRRLPRSCEECRRRKVKCDRNHPCSHCILTKCRCFYNTGPRLPRVHPGQWSPEVPSLNGRLPSNAALDAVPEVDPSLHQHSTWGPSPPTLSSTVIEGRSINSPFSRPLGLFQATGFETVNLDREPILPEQLSVRNRPTSGTKITPALASPIPSCHKSDNCAATDRLLALNKSRLFGQTHWTNAVHEFKRIAAFMNGEAINSTEQLTIPPLKVPIRELLQQCKHLSRNVKPLRPGRFLSCSEPIISSPDMADHLVYLYESNIESVFRILHGPSFRNEYEKYKKAPAEVTDVTMLKVQLVIAIGSGLCPELAHSQEVHKAACQWLYAAQSWVSGPMEKDRLNMDCMQVHCLLILARQVLSVGGDLSWVAMGVLLRTAMQLGLHRDPVHFDHLPVFEAEMRRRIWATVLELNAQAALDSGTPSGISYDDFDTRPPGNLNDEDLCEDSITLRQCNETTQTDTSLQRFLLQTLPTRLELLRRMNGLGIGLEDEKILALSAKLSAACREVNARVRTDHNAETVSFKRNMASLLLRRFLLVLHRPLAGRIHENAIYYHSRKVSFDSALALLNPPYPNDVFSYLMLRGGGLFKSCINHASLALASELLIEIEEQGSSTYRQMLVDAVKEARQKWAQRLKLGDTNVRLHMKLSIVLSQAEHVGEVGSQMHRRMAQSAKDSLELCYFLMKENLRSGRVTVSSEHGEWDSQSVHLGRGNEQLDFSRDYFDIEDIVQISQSNMDGAFDSNILLH
ncbi:hypothetical protein F4859DRAFT_488068 [Xylaria cf. heliscus]|nr:hypothetical protein F4859DRAFT_488068 [Xylaria cf. heliscus]